MRRKWYPPLMKAERIWVLFCVTVTPLLLVIDLLRSGGL